MRRRLLATALITAAWASRTLCAQTTVTEVATSAFPAPFNLAWQTLRGQQFWNDESVYGRWRIQANSITGHYRLLDPQDVRRAWGTMAQCEQVLKEFKREGIVPALHGRAVITLHGFGRSRDHMAPIGELLDKQGDWTWIDVSYASTRRSLDDHAQSLARVIEALDGSGQINFVCHRLGNLVVRRYLGEASQANPRWKPDPRIQRMVMLGPPSNGARMAEIVAELLNDNDVARLIAGPSAWQLARQWTESQKLLATPTFEFGILAGGCGDSHGLNPLLTGDDDLVVAVEET